MAERPFALPPCKQRKRIMPDGSPFSGTTRSILTDTRAASAALAKTRRDVETVTQQARLTIEQARKLLTRADAILARRL